MEKPKRLRWPVTSTSKASFGPTSKKDLQFYGLQQLCDKKWASRNSFWSYLLMFFNENIAGGFDSKTLMCFPNEMVWMKIYDEKKKGTYLEANSWRLNVITATEKRAWNLFWEIRKKSIAVSGPALHHCTQSKEEWDKAMFTTHFCS